MAAEVSQKEMSADGTGRVSATHVHVTLQDMNLMNCASKRVACWEARTTDQQYMLFPF